LVAGVLTAVLVGLCTGALAQTMTVQFTPLGCAFNLGRASYQNGEVGNPTPGSGLATNVGNVSTLLTQTYSAATTNKYFIVRIDGQIVWRRFITSGADYGTVYIGSYFGDTCQGSNTNQTYVACLQNQQGQSQRAWWKLNGFLMKQSYLAPGTSDCYTFHFNPNTDAITWGMETTTIQFVPTDTGDGGVHLDYLALTNTTQTSGGSGTNFSNGGANTNANLPANTVGSSVNWSNAANSGGINFTGTATTAAKDDTLRAGFNVLHSDLQDLHNDMNLGFLALQQSNNVNIVVTNTGANTNDGGTNMLTQAQLESINQNASNSATAGLETLASTTDMHTSADPNYTALAAGASGIASGAGLPGSFVNPSDPGPESGGDVQLPLIAAGITLNSSTVGTSPIYYGILRWCILFFVFMRVQRGFYRSLTDALFIPQANTAGTSVLGTNANAAAALVMASIIVGAVFAAFTLLLASVLSAGVGMMAVNPVSLWDSLGNGAHFVGAILPFKFMVAAWIALAVYETLKGSIMLVTMSIIKFAVGL